MPTSTEAVSMQAERTSPPGPVVAISYPRDEPYTYLAHSAQAALANYGAKTLFDEVDLRPGGDVVHYAHDMSTADYLVIMAGRAFFLSLHCMRELYYFESRGCGDRERDFRQRLIPVIIGPEYGAEGFDPLDASFRGDMVAHWTREFRISYQNHVSYRNEILAISDRVGRWIETTARVVFERDIEHLARSNWAPLLRRIGLLDLTRPGPPRLVR